MSKKIEKAEWFDDRSYKVGYKYITSVSTNLSIESKPFLLRWYADLGWDKARKKLNESGERGSRIHYAFEIFNLGGCVLFNPFNSPKYSKEQIDALETKYGG